MMPYLSGDDERELREALRLGATMEFLAGKARCDANELARFLGLPTAKPAEPAAGTEFDLWRTCELDAIL